MAKNPFAKPGATKGTPVKIAGGKVANRQMTAKDVGKKNMGALKANISAYGKANNLGSGYAKGANKAMAAGGTKAEAHAAGLASASNSPT